jgi:DNA-directed RNA polymerase specialized sigma24 family protein
MCKDADPALLEAQEDSAILHLCVEDALGQLPALHRSMAELRIEGHEVAEIARQVGRSKRTVERTLQDVRTRLRQILGTTD